ncbi:MAG: putative polysaccharide biosynthesis protein [Anaerotruncus rubiinfantis]|jgi:stage V sporulation protein B|uniref:putative polysaccharide biosynthesis protein n=1 Tax=Anaerotruncus rubiinfantis TaxID=1720200 RepID=UPI001898CC11|nr:polysaccharide biosynthesis protein [Anaerotruncus rubiinfantis]
MNQQHKQGYLYGTMVLAAGTMTVKVIGVLFKIPLTNILGGVGMSYFNVAYDLYYPLYALFVSGVPVAVSKLVSESIACGRARDARRLLRVSATVFVSIGSCGTILMFVGARWFAGLVDNPDACYAIWMLAPALFFGCVMAAFRGYWQGLQDMVPTAVSQIVEAVAKLILGLALAYLITLAGMREFARAGTVFGTACPSSEQAQLAVLPFAAAGAILGVTLSTVCGALYMVARHKLGKVGISSGQWRAAPHSSPAGTLVRRLLAIALPVCVASVIANLTTFIDLISVMNQLNEAIAENAPLITGMYAGAIPEGVGLDKLGSYLYGCYSGLAVPIYNLVPSLTTTIGVSLLPAVSAAWASRDRVRLTRNVSSALRIASLIAMPAGFGICALAEPIMHLLYFTKPMEVAVIAPALRVMGISAIFVALSLPVNAILQALGHADLPVKLLFIGGLLKLAMNYLLVPVPQLNIQAAPIGTLGCYAFVLLVSLWVLIRTTDVEIPVIGVFGKPLFAGILCGIAAKLSWEMLASLLPERLSTLVSIGIGGIVYLFIILFTKTLTKVDFLMVPGAEKFAKLLEKLSLLG